MIQFRNSINGYDKTDVKNFINEITNEFESMLNSLKAKDNEISSLKEKIEYYKNTESTINKAIAVADEASNQIKRLAREESNGIIDDAKRNASRIINEALLKAEKADNEAEMLKRRIATFKRRLRIIIEEQLEEVERIDENDL